MQQATQIQTTSLEITAVSNEKKSNPLAGFFKGVRDKFDGFKSAFKQEQDKDEKAEQIEKIKDKNGVQEKNIKMEWAAFANARGEMSASDILVDKSTVIFLLELLQALFGKKKFAVNEIVDELRKNAELTDEFKELIVAEIQKNLGENASLSKELITANLEKAINESQNLTQEQKNFYLSKLDDKDFMDKFYDILSIKDKEVIANKAKSSDELLNLVNQSFDGNFAKAKEKISKSQINSSTMNSLDDTAMKGMSKDDLANAFAENLKESKDLANNASKARKQGEK